MSKKSFLGLTGQRVNHFEPGDNYWSNEINNSLRAIADSLDRFEYGIDDIARETQSSTGLRFQELQDVLSEFVVAYTELLAESKDESVSKLKEYIELRLKDIANAFISSTQKDTTTLISFKSLVDTQLFLLNEAINYLKADFDKNSDEYINKINQAKASRDNVIGILNSNITNANNVLNAHIADKSNPHRTKIAQLANAVTVYQHDKDSSYRLIEPAIIAATVKDTVDPNDAVYVNDNQNYLFGKTLGIGDYEKNLNNGVFSGHYYISFHASLYTFTDSHGDSGTYITSGNLVILTWVSVVSTKPKPGTKWYMTMPTDFERLAPISVDIKAALSTKTIQHLTAFVIYLANAPYPNLLALFLGNYNKDVYVSDGSDDTLNWSIDIQGTPASWDSPFNIGTPNPDYWVQMLDEEPDNLDKYSVEGPYLTPPPDRWTASSYNIETSGFVNIASAPNLATFNYWGFDANGIYLRSKFSGNTVTFIYNMFERVPLLMPSSSSSTGDPDGAFESISTLSYTVEVSWTFPSSDKISIGDTISVTTKRRELQTGNDVLLSNTSGSFIVTSSVRFDGK